METEGRERLPSPIELQGKIILKGTFKKEVWCAQALCVYMWSCVCDVVRLKQPCQQSPVRSEACIANANHFTHLFSGKPSAKEQECKKKNV